VISVHDPDARHAHKTVARRQDGFKAHVAIEPDTGLVTDCRLGKASGEDSGDAAVGIELLATEQEPVEVLADSAYGTGAMLAELREAEHTATIKPWPLRHPIPGGFTTADFTVDETTRTITCPAGATMTFSKVKRSARFGARCQGCPLRERCTTSARGRTVVLHRHDALQRAHRTRFADPAVLKVYRQHRPMVERSIAWLVAGGNRRLRYRGTAKNDAWLHQRTAALNLRRLLTLGLHRQRGTWAITAVA